jgi:hypothetical protein
MHLFRFHFVFTSQKSNQQQLIASKTFTCEHCDEDFSSEKSLQNHLLVRHTTHLSKLSHFEFATFDELDRVYFKEGMCYLSIDPVLLNFEDALLPMSQEILRNPVLSYLAILPPGTRVQFGNSLIDLASRHCQF